MTEVAMIDCTDAANEQTGKLAHCTIISKPDMAEPMFYGRPDALVANLDGYLIAPLSAFNKRHVQAIRRRLKAQTAK